MIFTVKGNPQGKGRARVTVRGAYARAYTPETTASYENLVKLSYLATKDKIEFDKPVKMTIFAYYKIPKSFSLKKAGEARSGALKPSVKPDIDNVVKIICDGLNGVAYKDDTQVIAVTAIKYYSDEPRVVVGIENF